MIKIIGGKFRKTTLLTPKKNVRPTSSMKREAIFSIIENYSNKKKINIYYQKSFLDFFAGTGAMGLEAISRGAKYCYFFENNKEAIAILKKNCNKVCKEKNFQINEKNILEIINFEINYSVSVVLMDPPYKIHPFKKILIQLLKNKFLTKETIFVIESEKNTKIDFPINLNIFDEKIYGKSKITFLNFLLT